MSRLLFLNQTRQKIGVTYGSNLTTSGGTALKFYASVRMEIRRIGAQGGLDMTLVFLAKRRLV